MPTCEYRGRGEARRNKRVSGEIVGWLEVQVSLCHYPWILWGPVFFVCSPSGNRTSAEWCLVRDRGRKQRVQQEQKTKHGLNFFLIGIKYIRFTPALSTLPSLCKAWARLFLEEMNEMAWAISLNYSHPTLPILTILLFWYNWILKGIFKTKSGCSGRLIFNIIKQ